MENWCFLKSSSLLKGMNVLINSFWFLWCYRKDHLHPSPFQLLMSQQPPLPREAHHHGENCERFHLRPLPRDLLDKMHQLIERTYKTLVSCLDAVKWTQLSSFFWSKTSFFAPAAKGSTSIPPRELAAGWLPAAQTTWTCKQHLRRWLGPMGHMRLESSGPRELAAN